MKTVCSVLFTLDLNTLVILVNMGSPRVGGRRQGGEVLLSYLGKKPDLHFAVCRLF